NRRSPSVARRRHVVMPTYRLTRRAIIIAPLLAFLATAAAAQQTAMSVAQSKYSGLLSRPARLKVQDTPLPAALAELVERSEVPIALSPSRLPDSVRVTCACDSLTVGGALTVLLAN